MDNFVNLHIHSEYSLLDGACRIKDIPKKALSLGQTAAAVTDCGNLYAAVDFYNQAKANGIKPIIGCEIYVTSSDDISDNEAYNLTLLCENNIGYNNLIQLVSYGCTKGMREKPTVPKALLRQYSEGLIALSGSKSGEIPTLVSNEKFEQAYKTALEYKSIFGENNFFLEVQVHKNLNEQYLLQLMSKLGKLANIPLCAANDVHYLEKSEAKAQRILTAIRTGSNLKAISGGSDEYYMKSRAEMEILFPNNPEALDNTVKIAKRCNVTFDFNTLKLPKYPNDNGIDNVTYFISLCKKGLVKRYGENPPDEYKKRLQYELDTIINMGFADYFLIVWDFIAYAKNNDIPVGPGRGSGAGSLAAYCIGITNIDPMKYDLLFERFLNPERVTMPDFDIDFCYEKRQQVIDYVIKKYGKSNVAQIITFGTLAAKAAVRDVGRAMALPYPKIDAAARLIPSDNKITLKKALEEVPELKNLYLSDNDIHELIDNAASVEGMPRHISTHAAGVIISDKPLNSYVPVQRSGDILITQYPMNILESLGLLKMDFLALKNLTIIDRTAKAVGLSGRELDNIPLDDKAVFDMLSKGDSDGVFQLESGGMKNLLRQLKPRSIEDIIAAISLHRPGPMDSIPKYIEMRNHPERIRYKHPLLKDILEVTCGCIVYQEQVMQICQALADYSFGRADLVRRAMAKKKADIMEQERNVFISGAVKKGVPQKTAESIFEEMSGFASYAFNKSHAAAYAYVAYQTAYLKCHYFKEYMSELMTNDIGSQGKLEVYISLCRKRGVKLLPPNVNYSFSGFTAEENGIRIGLTAIKGIGRNLVGEIISSRQGFGKFLSLKDFLSRINSKELNRKAVDGLVKSGALDNLGYNRREMLDNYMFIFGINDSSGNEGQVSFFEQSASQNTFDGIKKYEEYPQKTLLMFEKEVLGMYISGHPLDEYSCLSSAARLNEIQDIFSERNERNVKLICTITSVKQLKTKKGTDMAFAHIEDVSGECEVIIFPEAFSQYYKHISNDSVVFLYGKTSYKDEVPKIIAEKLIPAVQYASIIENGELFIRISPEKKNLPEQCTAICHEHLGNGKLTFYLENEKKYLRPKNMSGIRITEELLKSLSEIAGRENVAVSAL